MTIMCAKHDMECPQCGHSVNLNQAECPSCKTEFFWHDDESRYCISCQAGVPPQNRPKTKSVKSQIEILGESMAHFLAHDFNVAITDKPCWHNLKSADDLDIKYDQLVDIPNPTLYALLRLICDDNIGSLLTLVLTELATLLVLQNNYYAVPVLVNGQPKLAIVNEKEARERLGKEK